MAFKQGRTRMRAPSRTSVYTLTHPVHPDAYPCVPPYTDAHPRARPVSMDDTDVREVNIVVHEPRAAVSDTHGSVQRWCTHPLGSRIRHVTTRV